MKMTIDIECTPEEARRLAGLPNLSPLHDRYIEMMRDAMDGTFRPEAIEAMMRGWGPMSDAGMTIWRSLIEQGVGTAGR